MPVPVASLDPRALELNEQLRVSAPTAFSALSPLGLAAYYPKDIPFQAAEAKGAEFNATIGQITDGAGSILSVSSISRAVNLDPTGENRALLYSPIGGHLDVRTAWNRYQTPAELLGPDGDLPCGPPLVTVGLTHAISLVADLFGGPGRDVVIPDPCWGNYVQTFGIRSGCRVHGAQSYEEGRWSWQGLERTLAGLSGEAPLVVVINLPSNPGGYSPTVVERAELKRILVETAERRTTVVLCDDAYAGLVYEPDIPKESVFWDLLGAHPALLPVRGAGSTKEFLLFGGRVGFLTLPFSAESAAFQILEDKLFSLIRSSVGSPVSLSQMVLLAALQSESSAAEISEVRSRLRGRYAAMREALEGADGYGETFKVLPCNSGAFMLLELNESLDSEEVRQRLLRESSTGVVAIRPRYIRLAFCSVSGPAIAGLVERVVSALR